MPCSITIFYILIHVPGPKPVSDPEFEKRLRALCDGFMVKNLMAHLAGLRQEGQDEAAERVKAPYVARMYELSEFCKTLKQRFTQSYNHRHTRKGTLWEERFKSILVQGREHALSAIAGYIDLNPVRAGIVSDPRRYRFSPKRTSGARRVAGADLGDLCTARRLRLMPIAVPAG